MTEHVDEPRDQWPKPLLGVVALILFGLVGWLTGDTVSQVRTNARDITKLQEQYNYIRESQARTEDSLKTFNSLQQQLLQALQQERRR